MPPFLPAARPLPSLPYRKPQEGRDYWIVDGILPDAEGVAERFRTLEAWEMGFPHSRETWPGMRSRNALRLEELEPLEAKVRELTGARRLWSETAPDGAYLNHNVVQVVGARESGPRPHTDSRRLCRYAAVIYLTPRPPEGSGTTFYRLRYPNGTLSGNVCPAPHANLGRLSVSRACRSRPGTLSCPFPMRSIACCSIGPTSSIPPRATSATTSRPSA